MVRIWHTTHRGTKDQLGIVTSCHAEDLACYQANQVADDEESVLGQVFVDGEGNLFDGGAAHGNAGEHDETEEGRHDDLHQETVGQLSQHSEHN